MDTVRLLENQYLGSHFRMIFRMSLLHFLVSQRDNSWWKYDYFHMVGIIGKCDQIAKYSHKEDKLCSTIYWMLLMYDFTVSWEYLSRACWMPGSGLDSSHTDIKRHWVCASQKLQQGNCCQRTLKRVFKETLCEKV